MICPKVVSCVAISLTDNPVTHTPLTDVKKASINYIVPEIGRNNKIPPIKLKNKNVAGRILTGDFMASEYTLSTNKLYVFLSILSIINHILS